LEDYNIELTAEEEFKAFNAVRKQKRYELYKQFYKDYLISGLSLEETEKKALEASEIETVVLTEEEENNALNEAKKAKYYQLKTSEYYEALKKDKVYKIPSEAEYRNLILESAKTEIEGFKISNEFEMLCRYFTGSPNSELDLKKGIILAGSVGTGKTSLMRLFKSNPFNPYVVVSCRVVADAYKTGGVESVNKYYESANNIFPMNFYGHKKLGWCMDDLGTENSKKHYGDELNVLSEVILNWYDKKQFNKLHFTTNLGAQEIEQYYGERVKSRMREMFNFIVIKNKEDLRK